MTVNKGGKQRKRKQGKGSVDQTDILYPIMDVCTFSVQL